MVVIALLARKELCAATIAQRRNAYGHTFSSFSEFMSSRLPFRTPVILTMSIGIAVGCAAPAEKSASASPSHHPHPSFLREASLPAAEWRLADRSGGMPLPPFAPTHLILGMADYPEEQVFGDIGDAALLSDGRIAILDALS